VADVDLLGGGGNASFSNITSVNAITTILVVAGKPGSVAPSDPPPGEGRARRRVSKLRDS
jgi:hypothetical protein